MSKKPSASLSNPSKRTLMNFTRRNLLAAGAILSLPGFASSAFAAETVTVPSQTGDVAVPVDPKRQIGRAHV